jgi:arginase
MKKIDWILTPFFLDQHLEGLEDIADQSWDINQPSSLPKTSTMVRLSALHADLAASVERSLTAGNLPVSIAGDCCTAIGVLAGMQRAGINPTLIWFDAHGDFNTWETSPSGFLGGMPLAMLAGFGEQTLLDRNQVKPLSVDQIILIDGRDLDPGEAELIADSGLTHLQNPADLMEVSLEKGPIWVHFDTDVVDPLESPAQNYPAPGGPTSILLRQLFQYLENTNQIRMVSVSSWNPDLPGAEKSRDVSLDLLHELIGLEKI